MINLDINNIFNGAVGSLVAVMLLAIAVYATKLLKKYPKVLDSVVKFSLCCFMLVALYLMLSSKGAH